MDEPDQSRQVAIDKERVRWRKRMTKMKRKNSKMGMRKRKMRMRKRIKKMMKRKERMRTREERMMKEERQQHYSERHPTPRAQYDEFLPNDPEATKRHTWHFDDPVFLLRIQTSNQRAQDLKRSKQKQ
jgi:hypothetical protein